MDTYPRHIVAVTGVVTDEAGRVLLVKSERRGWEPPGGQVELGESLDAALQREVQEESGCTVRVGRLVSIASNISVPEKVIFTFRCSYLAGELQPSDETPEVGWFDPDDALTMVTHPAQHDRLQDALADGERVIYRVYQMQPYTVLHERWC